MKPLNYCFWTACLPVLMSGCSGSGSGLPPPVSVSVSITGLSGTGLILQDNGGDNLAVTTASAAFATPVASNAAYLVTVLTQPTNPSQTCAVQHASGTSVSGSAIVVPIACTTNTYVISADVTGLPAPGLVLQDSGGDKLPIPGAGTFTFSTPVASGAPYHVTVLPQALTFLQTCTLNDGSGTVAASNISISVVCNVLGVSVSPFAGSATNFIASAVALDAARNLYIADCTDNEILELTPAGRVSTLAGNPSPGKTDGNGGAASFNCPQGVAVDPAGYVYVADTGNNEIRKITPAGVVSTLAGNPTAGSADGTGSTASFSSPEGVAVDAAGNIYVADADNNAIRLITPAGLVSTLAGNPTAGSADGTGPAASFSSPEGVAVDAAGNIYVADADNNAIRLITPAGRVSTLAGNPPGTNYDPQCGCFTGTFQYPVGVAVDAKGTVYVANSGNVNIVAVSPAGAVTATTDVPGFPTGVAVDATGNVYVALNPGSSGSANPSTSLTSPGISKITPSGGVSTVPGTTSAGSANGLGSAASFSAPVGIAADAAGNVYVADAANNEIRRITPGGMVSTVAGTPTAGSADGSGSAASFYYPQGIAVDAAGNLYVADTGNAEIRRITPDGAVTTLAGNGTSGSADGSGATASFSQPIGIAVDSAGNIYVGDSGNNEIRKITPAGIVSTLAGQTFPFGHTDGNGSAASFWLPEGVAVDSAGNVYVADAGNSVIRKITPDGTVSTLAGSGTDGSLDGTGTATRFKSPAGVAVDPAGNVFVADMGNDEIRVITPAGIVTTLAGLSSIVGSAAAGSANGTGAAARFNAPAGVAVDSAGNLYVADTDNNQIRRITFH